MICAYTLSDAAQIPKVFLIDSNPCGLGSSIDERDIGEPWLRVQ